jgi:hypothetical protein
VGLTSVGRRKFDMLTKFVRWCAKEEQRQVTHANTVRDAKRRLNIAEKARSHLGRNLARLIGL